MRDKRYESTVSVQLKSYPYKFQEVAARRLQAAQDGSLAVMA